MADIICRAAMITLTLNTFLMIIICMVATKDNHTKQKMEREIELYQKDIDCAVEYIRLIRMENRGEK